MMSQSNQLTAAYAARRPQSMDLYRRAQGALAAAVGHDLRHFHPVPMYIERGEGSRKWDVDGNEYIDFLMGNGALLLGHADPEVVDAVRHAAGRGLHFGNDHPLQIEWAERVQRMAPSAERVRFVNSGTEATQLALRVARAATGKTKVLRFAGHFHGWHDEVVHGFQAPFDADGSLGVSPRVRDDVVSLSDGNIELVEELLSQNRTIAAAIVEPSGGSWGRMPLDPEYLRELRAATARYGVLLIFDEVITGFRFSPGGAQTLYDVRPDLSCFAKILAGGMPGGALAGRADVMSVFDITGDSRHDRYQRVAHQGTFNASPLAAAAGIALLRRVETGEPIRRANAAAERLRAAWDAILERHHIAGYVYGPSSVFHVYFETDVERVKSATQRAQLATVDGTRLKGIPGGLISEYQRRLREHGVDVMSGTGGVLSSVHTDSDLDQATAAFERTVVSLRDDGLLLALH